MCIIVDANVFPAVFIEENPGHSQYLPVEKHIRANKSKLIIGGAHYDKEMPREYLQLIEDLARMNCVIAVNDDLVNQLEDEIKTKYPDPKFNDPHIIALAFLSNARILCTRDVRSKLKDYMCQFYNGKRGKKRPAIYNDTTPHNVIPPGRFNPPCKYCP